MEPTIAGGQVCRWHARVPLRQVSQMFRVTFPTQMDDRQLSRWIKRVLLLLVVGTIAFAAFYAFDRWRPATTPIVDQRLAALEQAVRDTPDDVASRGQLADTRTRSSSTTRSSRRARRTSLRSTAGQAPTWASGSSTTPRRTTRRWSTSPRTSTLRAPTGFSRAPTT